MESPKGHVGKSKYSMSGGKRENLCKILQNSSVTHRFVTAADYSLSRHPGAGVQV